MFGLQTRATLALAGVFFVWLADVSAQSITPLPVPGVPIGISGDGSVVVGNTSVAGALPRVYRLDSKGVTYLDELPPELASYANALSADGRNTAGADVQFQDPICGVPASTAVAWLHAHPPVELGLLSGDNRAEAFGVSNTGVVCGVSSLQLQQPICPYIARGFVWSLETGLVELAPVEPLAAALPRVISADGSVIAGDGRLSGPDRAFVWTRDQGMWLLPLANGISEGLAVVIDMSEDGRHILGECAFPNQAHGACIWTDGGPPRSLGALPGEAASNTSHATVISGDGAVVIGQVVVPTPGPPGFTYRTFIWDRVRGMRELFGALHDEFNVSLAGTSIYRITGMSRTGRYIIADGAAGPEVTGVLIDLGRPAACIGDFNLDGAIDSQDFFAFLTAFFAGDADINEDGVTTSADFFDFLAAFFNAC